MKHENGDVQCLRCLKCHPMPTGVPVVKAKKDNVKVDEPWTPERIWKVIEPKVRELFVDLIEDYVIAQNKSVELTWQEQAKAMGINPYGRKKDIVLAEMAEKTKEESNVDDSDQSPVE